MTSLTRGNQIRTEKVWVKVVKAAYTTCLKDSLYTKALSVRGRCEPPFALVILVIRCQVVSNRRSRAEWDVAGMSCQSHGTTAAKNKEDLAKSGQV